MAKGLIHYGVLLVDRSITFPMSRARLLEIANQNLSLVTDNHILFFNNLCFP